MVSSVETWWRQLRVQHKVWAVLVLLLIPLGLSLGAHLYITNELLHIQAERQSVLLTREHIHVIHRLAIDGEDAYHGYVMTKQPEFARALIETESELDRVLNKIIPVETGESTAANELHAVVPRLHEVLVTLREINVDIRSGIRPVDAGQRHLLSDALRKDLRVIEDQLDVVRRKLNARAERLSAWAFSELWWALAGMVVLGLVGSRLLARSITDPIARLQAAATRSGRQVDPEQFKAVLPSEDVPIDELGRLARSYHEMAVRIAAHIREVETLEAIGKEINAIGPDGLDGVLRRITDRAAESIKADACLVLLRNDKMGCWVVEAASGNWNERLHKSVMLWEEFPVSVRAFETGQVAYGSDLQHDRRPEVVRQNLIGNSMVAVPLVSQSQPFGVLVLLSQHDRQPEQWNEHLVVGLAQQAAVAISNARLYETVQERHTGLLARLRHLEFLAGTLAHDLKGPGQRMEELTKLIYREYHGQLDERVDRWLTLLRENGRELVERVESILAVASVGAGVGPVRAVDPSLVLGEVLKEFAGDLERRQGQVVVDHGLPMVACHAAYLRQIFDNLISNAVKYASPDRPVCIHVSAERQEAMARFSVRDNGIGIPKPHRARVFEPFVRLCDSAAPGTGIGLTIVQRIVELYGGDTWIEEAAEEGCTVRFTLPWFQEGDLFGTESNQPAASREPHLT